MTKKEIAYLIHSQTNLTQSQAQDSLNMTLESIITLLVQYGRVEIRGFGVFSIQTRAGRRARNPRTGEEVWVEEHETVVFKPSQLLKTELAQRRVQGKRKSAKKNAKTGTAAQDVAKKSTAKKAIKRAKRTK
ncbi:MAG: HU family DNA-binding protein [Planctomycetia bacterium]|nr:HU family DNA-binding protein [Planctomycetia bacterium]